MEVANVLRWIEQVLGWLLFLLALLDVFLTVLYARAGTGLIGNRIAHLTWRFFLWVSRPFGAHRGTILSFCGPVILVLLVLVWALLITVGVGLIFQPELGTAIRASSGETATDFVTAMYAAASSVSFVGASDFTPQTAPFRLIFLFNSIAGVSITSVVLTYIMQVYTALQRRNALGLKVHLHSRETGDAAEILAGLGPQGEFSGGYNNLSQLAVEVANGKESHHFYPVLFYFRFREPFYSVSQTSLQLFDTVTLIQSTLDDEEYGWLKQSAAVTQIWRGSMLLVTTLENTFLGGSADDQLPPTDPQTLDRWRRRYAAALRRLQQAGIKTNPDEEAGAGLYLSLRSKWDCHISRLAPVLAYDMDEIDPAGSDPEAARNRRELSPLQRFTD